MRIIDTSIVPGVGVQVVIALHLEQNAVTRTVLRGTREWPRFSAVAKRVAADLSLTNFIFERADVQPHGMRGVHVQLSYRESQS